MTPAEYIERIRSIAELASADEPIDTQREALDVRRRLLTSTWETRVDIQKAYPDGLWEMDKGGWCFCDHNPQGHSHEEPGCLFTDGEHRSWMCPICRKPADVHVKSWREGYPYGSTTVYQDYFEALTTCCGEGPVLPNGESYSDNASLEDFEP